MKKNIIILASICIICMPFSILSAQNKYTLEECRELALKNNIKIRSAKIDIESAQAQENDAKAAYFPTVMGGATYFHATDDIMKEKISLSSEDQAKIGETITALGLDVSALGNLPSEYTFGMIQHGTFVNLMALEPIYAGGKITAANKLARLQTNVKKLQLEQSENDVRQTVERYYWQLVSLYEKVKTLDAAEEQLRSIKKDADNAVDAGVALKNDQLTVQLKLNEIEANRLKINNAIRLSKMLLGQYTGTGEADVVVTNAYDIAEPASLLIPTDEALMQRVETQMLDKNVEAQQLQKKMKQGERLPTVAVGGVAMYQDMTSIGKTKVIGMATISVPISEWWSNSGVKRQNLAIQKAKEEREDNLQLMRIQMQSAYDNLDAAYQQVQIAYKSIEQSEENLRMNRDFYQAGTSGMSDLLDAQTQNQKAKDQLTDAVIEYQNAKTAYLVVTGR